MIREIAIVLLIIGAINTAGCSQHTVDSEKGGSMPERTIEQVQEEYTDEWMAIPGIEGIAIGLFEGESCIKIFSSKKAEDLRVMIPSSIEGYPVIIEETGTFHALDQQ
ncbi:hypothetical protein ACFL3Q_14490 [Planctomycetota bacterium]